METIGYFYKEPDSDFSKVKIVYKDFNVHALLEAFAKLMLRNEVLQKQHDNVREIPKDVHTVEEKVNFIKERLLEKGEVVFDSLFTTFSRNEIITTFQALLEMLKHQFITVRQECSFGAINIKLNPDWDLKEVSDEQFDEYN